MFTALTGWPVEEHCALVTNMTMQEEWPVQLRHLPDVSSGYSAVSVGGGWAKFLSDNNLSIGAFLTFEVVDERRLVVAHHLRCAAEGCEDSQQTDVESGTVRDWRPREPPSAEHTHRLATVSHTDVRLGTTAQFRKTIHKTNLTKHDSSRIVRLQHTCWSPLFKLFFYV